MNRSHVCTVLTCLALLVTPHAAHTQEPSAFAVLDNESPITYFISQGEPDSGYRDGDHELATWALQAWERSANGALRFEPGPEATARVRVYWVPPNFGLYGEMRSLVVDGRRGAAVYIRPDTDALGAVIGQRAQDDPLFRDTIVYLTCLHELGHALGLEHTADFADIMYFFGYGGDIPAYFGRYRDRLNSRGDIAGISGLSEGDLSKLRQLYGSGSVTGDTR